MTAATVTLWLMAGNATATGIQAEKDRFIDSLVARMTLHEKVGQLRMEYANVGRNPQALLDSIVDGHVGAMFTAPAASNEGLRAGETIVQLYIRDRTASVSRPVKELKGFEKLFLAPGQERQVTLQLPATALSFVDRKLRWVSEPGWFDVMVGLDSQTVQTASFELVP